MKSSSIFSYILLGTLMITPVSVFADTAESQAIVRLQAQLASLQQTVTSLLAVAATPASPNQGTGTGATPAIPAKKALTPTPVPQTTPVQSATPAQTSAPGQSETVKPATATQPPGQSETVKPTQQTTPVQPIEIKVERAAPMSPEAQTAKKAALEQIQIKIQSLQTKLADLARTTQAQGAVSRLEPKPVKTLQRGSSGDDIKQTQEFLKQFPDVYPQGLATGYFGPATENAVKHLQKKLGLASSGIIDSKTHDKLDEISLAHDRKKSPRINEISLDAISIGTRVTITGIGFTLENNAIAVRGRAVVQGISSDDGRTLSFPIPPDIRCQIGVACPIKVINKNGISNAKPFKLIDFPSVPEPTPTPIITSCAGINVSISSTTPPIQNVSPGQSGVSLVVFNVAAHCDLNLNSFAVSLLPMPNGYQNISSLRLYNNATGAQLDSTVAVSGAGLNFTGLNQSILSNQTLSLKVVGDMSPSSIIGSTVYAVFGGSSAIDTAGISVGNNASGNLIAGQTVTIIAPTSTPTPTPTVSSSPFPSPSPTPVITAPMISSMSPSAGALGSSVTLGGTGFMAMGNAVNFGGTVNAVSGISSVDGVKLTFTVPSGTSCALLTACSVSVTNKNGTSNIINFTLTQIINPVTVSTPNGNEQFTTGRQNNISWRGGIHGVHVALVEDTAVNGTDVSGLIVGWISTTGVPDSFVTWDTKQVCDISNIVCAPVSSGNYKILVVSENELGKVEIAQDGSGNWDVSDQPFTIAPSPAITVVYPNGGEKIVQGTSVTISWNATNIANKNVTIRLLKGTNGEMGGYYIPNVPQSSDTGSFFYTWQVPTNLGDPSDYIMEIYDPLNLAVRDTSDTPFKIIPKSAITVLSPNNGELWVKNFQGTVRWNSANILSKAVTIDLLKSGTFYKTLAVNVPQAYSWSTTFYTSGTFSYVYNIPTDIPVDSDYTIRVSDTVDSATTDTSDATFRIIDLPNPVTVSGRLIDRFSLEPMANISLSGGKVYPYPTNDSNGGFSVSAITTDMNATNRSKGVVGAWPQCYANWATSLSWRTDDIYVQNSGFDNVNPSPYSFTRMLEQSNVALGDVPMWPMTKLIAIADTPMRVSVTYANSGYYSGSLAVDALQTVMPMQALALNYDLKAVFTNTAGQSYSSPFINIGLENKCAPKALSFLNGQFIWEPYTIVPASYKSVIGSAAPYTMTTFSPVPYSPSFSVNVGQSFMLTTTLNGGVAPYNWKMLYGALPLGLTLDPLTGVISGTPTTAGIYNFSVLVTDGNGVHGAMVIQFTVK